MEDTSGPVVDSTTTSLTSKAFDGDPANSSDQLEVAETWSDVSEGNLEGDYIPETVRELDLEISMERNQINSSADIESGAEWSIKSQTKATRYDARRHEKCCIKVNAEWSDTTVDVGEILKQCSLHANREHWMSIRLIKKLSDPSSASECSCFRLLNFFTNQYSAKDLTLDFIQSTEDQLAKLMNGQGTFHVDFTLRQRSGDLPSKFKGVYLLINAESTEFDEGKVIKLLSELPQLTGVPKIVIKHCVVELVTEPYDLLALPRDFLLWTCISQIDLSELISNAIKSSGDRSVERTLNDFRQLLAKDPAVRVSSVSSTLRSHLVIDGSYQIPPLEDIICVDRKEIQVLILCETTGRLKWEDELFFIGSLLGLTLQIDRENITMKRFEDLAFSAEYEVLDFAESHRQAEMLMLIVLCHSNGISLPDGTKVADVITQLGRYKNPIKVMMFGYCRGDQCSTSDQGDSDLIENGNLSILKPEFQGVNGVKGKKKGEWIDPGENSYIIFSTLEHNRSYRGLWFWCLANHLSLTHEDPGELMIRGEEFLRNDLPDQRGKETEGASVQNPTDLEPANTDQSGGKAEGSGIQQPVDETPAQSDAEQLNERCEDLAKATFPRCFRRYSLSQLPEYDELTEIMIDVADILRKVSENSQNLHTVNKLNRRFKLRVGPRRQEEATPTEDT